MKLVALITLLAGSLFLMTGCATPAYSAQERNQQVARDMDYDLKQATDDFDHMFLLRPASRLTIWNVR